MKIQKPKRNRGPIVEVLKKDIPLLLNVLMAADTITKARTSRKITEDDWERLGNSVAALHERPFYWKLDEMKLRHQARSPTNICHRNF